MGEGEGEGGKGEMGLCLWRTGRRRGGSKRGDTVCSPWMAR